MNQSKLAKSTDSSLQQRECITNERFNLNGLFLAQISMFQLTSHASMSRPWNRMIWPFVWPFSMNILRDYINCPRSRNGTIKRLFFFSFHFISFHFISLKSKNFFKEWAHRHVSFSMTHKLYQTFVYCLL